MDKDESTEKLFTAIRNRDATAAKAAIDAGAQINGNNDRLQTPLHVAAATNQAYLASLLIANGADINATDFWGKTPSESAVEHGYPGLAKIIKTTAVRRQGHADRVTKERTDKGPPLVGG